MMIHRNMARRKSLAVKSVDVPKKSPVEKPAKPEYTREEVEKMPWMKLKSIAKKNGIDTETLGAKEVRSSLIDKLGL